MSGGDPGRIGSRLLEACVGLLLAAMALYGAISILRAIWLYLCIVVLVVGVGALMWWRISSKYRGW
ncbi:hypothetical protein [Nocardia farcinica]|uniref:hypothetical protein n=1 Tax=Nocardia farcinica TaxID=37329 RepID=UPI001895F1A2|nr:hypothetical protein [Nocardia farcinica]MBF6188917.1 hypothetical protein [Nocardia farcinica]MBF6410446.1 hypothetical protein [Nocardia farcinica]